jgi:hypothetical protein
VFLILLLKFFFCSAAEMSMSIYSNDDDMLYKASVDGVYAAPYGLPGDTDTSPDQRALGYSAAAVGSYVDFEDHLNDGAASAVATAHTTPAEAPMTDIIARFYWNEKLQLLLERSPHTPEDLRK